eukprot:Pgem_evm1s11024
MSKSHLKVQVQSEEQLESESQLIPILEQQQQHHRQPQPQQPQQPQQRKEEEKGQYQENQENQENQPLTQLGQNQQQTVCSLKSESTLSTNNKIKLKKMGINIVEPPCNIIKSQNSNNKAKLAKMGVDVMGIPKESAGTQTLQNIAKLKKMGVNFVTNNNNNNNATQKQQLQKKSTLQSKDVTERPPLRPPQQISKKKHLLTSKAPKVKSRSSLQPSIFESQTEQIPQKPHSRQHPIYYPRSLSQSESPSPPTLNAQIQTKPLILKSQTKQTSESHPSLLRSQSQQPSSQIQSFSSPTRNHSNSSPSAT